MSRVALVAVLCLACERRVLPPGDTSVVVVDAERAAIKQGQVGADHQRESSYVLVDVGNKSDKDRLIAVEGQLLDGAGHQVAELGGDELRIPAGGARAFALVADKPAPAAARATFHVMRARVVDYPAPVEILDEKITRGDLTVVTASARNTAKPDGTAVIAAAFYDDAGRILARPFTVVALPGGEQRVVRFEGPRAAARATVFAAEVAF